MSPIQSPLPLVSLLPLPPFPAPLPLASLLPLPAPLEPDRLSSFAPSLSIPPPTNRPVFHHRTVICKLVGIIFSISAGLIAGKEGPFVHGGGVVGSGISNMGSRSISAFLRWIGLGTASFQAPRHAGGYFRCVLALEFCTVAFVLPDSDALWDHWEAHMRLTPEASLLMCAATLAMTRSNRTADCASRAEICGTERHSRS